MIREFKNKDEMINAFKKSIGLRNAWREAISKNMSKEEMAKIGLRTVNVTE